MGGRALHSFHPRKREGGPNKSVRSDPPVPEHCDKELQCYFLSHKYIFHESRAKNNKNTTMCRDVGKAIASLRNGCDSRKCSNTGLQKSLNKTEIFCSCFWIRQLLIDFDSVFRKVG